MLSSTRRLFGNPYSLRTEAQFPGDSPMALTWAVHRRLAEFATILGDKKTALANWDILSKEYNTGLVCITLFILTSFCFNLQGCSTLRISRSSRPIQFRSKLVKGAFGFGAPDNLSTTVGSLCHQMEWINSSNQNPRHSTFPRRR